MNNPDSQALIEEMRRGFQQLIDGLEDLKSQEESAADYSELEQARDALDCMRDLLAAQLCVLPATVGKFDQIRAVYKSALPHLDDEQRASVIKSLEQLDESERLVQRLIECCRGE